MIICSNFFKRVIMLKTRTRLLARDLRNSADTYWTFFHALLLTWCLSLYFMLEVVFWRRVTPCPLLSSRLHYYSTNSWWQIVQAVITLDDILLDMEIVRSLRQQAPTADDLTALKEFDGDHSKLGKVSSTRCSPFYPMTKTNTASTGNHF